jgi:site-specific recombinase
VTISTTGATFAFSSLGTAGAGTTLAWTIAGLGIIGFLNFAVSFCLAIFVAARAQRVHRSWAWHFFRSLWRSSPIPPRS